MFRTRYSVVCGVLLAAAAWIMGAPPTCAAAANDKKPAGSEQAKLIAVLQSEAPAAEKAIACKRLAIYGGKEAVPALAPLLANDQLASWARIALQAIPDPAAEDALREALGKLQGRLLIGVINSIAVRRDAKAVDSLIGRLKDADAEVAFAAAVALGRIGGTAAEKTLVARLADTPAAVRSAVAEGCILCAEKLQADGNCQQAIQVFDAVCKADVPKQRIMEATRGAILARGPAGIPLLVEQLKSPEKARFAIGLRVAQELPGREVTEALTAELSHAASPRQTLLIQVLADRGDTAALPAVLEAAKSGSEEVRGVAILALGRLGNASCVPLLLEAAVGPQADLAQTALNVLAAISNKEVDAEVIARLANAKDKTRRVLIRLAGSRSIAAAVPLLKAAADDTDPEIRFAALIALGRTVAFDGLPVLIARAVDAPKPDEAAVAVQALTAACQRMPDREACAARLAAAVSSPSVAAKCRILEVLAGSGGAKALKMVAAAARDSSPEVQETASRLLGEWMDMEVAPVLLDLAKNAADDKHKIRALRGYIRLVRQFPLSQEERARMCQEAMNTAQRPAEKKLVLEVIGRYPHAAMLPLVLEAAKVPELKSEAVAVAVMLTEKMGSRSVELQKMLGELGHGKVKIEILKAEYGAGAKVKDVTTILRKHVHDFPVIVLPSPNYSAAFGGDPAPSSAKQLKIQYRMADKPGEASFQENATIVLPMPK